MKGKLLLSLEGYKGWVNSVDFTPDGLSVLTASNDGTVRSWRLPSELRTPDEVPSLIQQRVPLRFEDGLLVPVLRRTTQGP